MFRLRKGFPPFWSYLIYCEVAKDKPLFEVIWWEKMTTVILLESLLELSQMDGNCLLLLLIYLQAAWKLSFGVSRLEYIFWWSNSTFPGMNKFHHFWNRGPLATTEWCHNCFHTHPPLYDSKCPGKCAIFTIFFIPQERGSQILQRFFEIWPGLLA